MPEMTFGPDDEDAFFTTRDKLLERFGESVVPPPDMRVDDVTADASMFLDWRWNYSTGELDRYRPDDLYEFLVDWCPRKYSAPPEAMSGMCSSLSLFFAFMEDQRLLHRASSSGAEMGSVAEDLLPEAEAAMADESNFGMAKSFFAQAFADGDVPESEEEMQQRLDQVMEEFNSLPFEERKQLTDRQIAPQAHQPRELPYLHVPPSDYAVHASAAGSPVLVKMEALRDYLGPEGRSLTAKGNLKLADAKDLIDVLDTGDVWERRYGKVTSSQDLPKLSFLFDWALEARVVRRHRGRAVPVKAWAKVHPVDKAQRLLDLLLEWSIFADWSRAGFGYMAWRDMQRQLVADSMLHAFGVLLAPELVIEVDDFADSLIDIADEHLAGRPEYQDLERDIPRDLARALRRLELAGVIVWKDAETRTDPQFGDLGGLGEYDAGGTIELTDFGRHAAPPIVEELGYALPEMPDLTSAPASELLRLIAYESVAAMDGATILRQWQPFEGDTARAEQLVAAVTDGTSTGAERGALFFLLAELGPEEVEPIVRRLTGDDAIGQHAWGFLAVHGLATEDELPAEPPVGPLLDTLSVNPPEEIAEEFWGNIGGREQATAFINQAWRYPEPETAVFLDAIGKHVPDKRVAKAARKAAMRHRSLVANR